MQGLDPESLNSHFENLAAAQKAYAAAARKNRFRFVQKQEAKVSEEKLEEIAKVKKVYRKKCVVVVVVLMCVGGGGV